ncbi:gamma carbonic anhydrase family protein [Lysobacter bugurensis]|uniref:Gamma carbonic anhydrase family protein n=2 Tax=Cognatilysobacter bugurensis TaxID=543356 RepID=A0A918T166_9GAMM|nr:gamma carbonic anhydrase family protein [Lysobacter bugurensis]
MRCARRGESRARRDGAHAAAYNSLMNIRPYLDTVPALGARVYIDPAATVIGRVTLADDVSIWPACVVRGDVNTIEIGARTNVQDGTVIHVSHDGPHAKLGGYATVIGSDVTIGHKAIVHACRIEDTVLIGMGAILLDGVVVKTHAFIGAGALVAPGKVVGEGELWLGNPAKKVRVLSDAEIEGLHYSAQHYVRLKDRYLGIGA